MSSSSQQTSLAGAVRASVGRLKCKRGTRVLLLAVLLTVIPLEAAGPDAGEYSGWRLSLEYLGLTYHPTGGTTPEIYPLKFDKKAYLVLSVGATGNLDYSFNRFFFVRLTSALYADCAFVLAGAVHAGPRLQVIWGKNNINLGMGPIFCFRQDWHRFKEYVNDDFYGDRVYRGWQYRFFPAAIELEYLRRINSTTELQWTILPGVPSVVTLMVGARFSIPWRRA
jgi:hypothetical protein